MDPGGRPTTVSNAHYGREMHLIPLDSEANTYGCGLCGVTESGQWLLKWTISDFNNEAQIRTMWKHFKETHPNWKKTPRVRPQPHGTVRQQLRLMKTSLASSHLRNSMP